MGAGWGGRGLCMRAAATMRSDVAVYAARGRVCKSSLLHVSEDAMPPLVCLQWGQRGFHALIYHLSMMISPLLFLSILLNYYQQHDTTRRERKKKMAFIC